MNVPRRHQSGDEKEEKVTAWSFREPPAVTPFLKRKKGDSPKLETQTHPTLSKPNTGARRTLFKRKKEIKAPLLNSTRRTLCLGIRHGLFPPSEAKAPSLEPFIGGHLVYSLWPVLTGQTSVSVESFSSGEETGESPQKEEKAAETHAQVDLLSIHVQCNSSQSEALERQPLNR